MNFKQIKDRRIIQIISAYAAISWAILQIIDQVVDRSIFPEIVYKISLTLIIAISPGVIIIAWFHGAKGNQKIPIIEKWLLSTVVVISLLSCFFILRINLRKVDESSIDSLPLNEDPRRIAVLYFEPRGDTKDAELISNGLTEALIDELSKIPDLFVISQNGSELFRYSDKNLKEIGKSLEVGLLVNGSVNLSKDMVRFRLSLVESLTGRQLESSRIDYSSFQIFDLIDDVTGKVSDFLRRKIGEELTQVDIRQKNVNVKAWKLVQEASLIEKKYVRGASGEDNDFIAKDFKRADSLYSLAEQLDQKWGIPSVRRGWLAYRQLRIYANDRAKAEHWISVGLNHADNALEKESDNSDALELKATLLYFSWIYNLVEDRESTFNQAEQLFNESIKSNPKQASALNSLSHLYLNKGWISEAKQAAKTAYNIDPYLNEVDRTIWRLLTISFDQGDSQETKRWSLEGLRRFPDDYRFYEGMILLNTMPGIEPVLDDTWKYYYKCMELCPKYDSLYRSKRCLQLMAMILAKANLRDSARIVSLKGRASVEEDPTREVAFLESVARLWIEDYDEAIRLMGLFFSANPGLAEGYKDPYLNKELFWYQEGLYGQSRFESLIGIR